MTQATGVYYLTLYKILQNCIYSLNSIIVAGTLKGVSYARMAEMVDAESP